MCQPSRISHEACHSTVSSFKVTLCISRQDAVTQDKPIRFPITKSPEPRSPNSIHGSFVSAAGINWGRRVRVHQGTIHNSHVSWCDCDCDWSPFQPCRHSHVAP
ncbi:hypothetical protein ACKLNR_010462 [Fusarium oxysporum f. sp. zingiberi]